MATPARTQALSLPGTLYAGVTDPTAAAPHGGTALGLVVQVEATEGETGARPITAHEWGGATVAWIRGAETWAVQFLIRGLDTDAFNKCFRDTFTAGSYRGRRPLLGSAGELASVQTLLYAPRSSGLPGLLLYAAAIVGRPTRHKLAEYPAELCWAVRFEALPNATSGRFVEFAPLANMTVP